MTKEKCKYLMEEYSMLKDAHFQTSSRITTFFQYALLIISAPLALLAAEGMPQELIATVFSLIGIIGMLVMLYLSRLRTEALLYARNMNRIRNTLYSDMSLRDPGIGIDQIHRQKILFSQEKKPAYSDWSQFGYIVGVLGLLDAFYFAFGMYNFISLPGEYCQWIIENLSVVCLSIGLLWLMLHFLFHKIVSLRSENGSDYYKRIIGVDIDGVLNRHEESFVAVYNNLNGTVLSEGDITTLPVSKSGIINREEENRVFHTIEYWTNMPVREDVVQNLVEEIKNKRGYKVYLFTWRDWAVDQSLDGKETSLSIKRHTKEWLAQFHIFYNRIRFEKGNIDRPVSMFSQKYRTRYFYAQKYKIRFFVEDSTLNAISLSRICEYVFLFNHLYNANDSELPYNIIRVNDWNEVLDWIKKLD